MIADVLVIGAGPAGSATALDLARRGVGVVLVDRARFPRPKPCGDYLNPRAAAALQRLGLHDTLRTCGGRVLRGLHIVTPKGRSAEVSFPGTPGMAIERAHLDALLVRAAAGAGAILLEEHVVGAVEREGSGWTVRAAWRGRGVTLRADILVGADGFHGRCAHWLGLAGRSAPTHVSPRFSIGGYFEGVDGAGDLEEMHLGDGVYCGVSPLDGAANITMALPAAALRAQGPDRAFWTGVRRLPGLAPRLERARVPGALRATGPLRPYRRMPAAPRAALVGDAAGFLEPLTGQGVSLALLSAARAAEAIAASLGRGTPDDLSAYARWRISLAAAHAGASAVRALALHGAARGILVPMLGGSRPLATALLGLIGGIDGEDSGKPGPRVPHTSHAGAPRC
ncbi:MAG: FAD-dependent oxidoreductase [Armatimonadetes bacterium]|nr:FAD-dependent oxidoreductase [Armatimonadota bacterium]